MVSCATRLSRCPITGPLLQESLPENGYSGHVVTLYIQLVVQQVEASEVWAFVLVRDECPAAGVSVRV